MRIDEFEFQDRNGNEIEPTKNQLVVYIKSLHKQIAELKKQLEEIQDFIKLYDCDNFEEFKSFIGSCHLTPAEKEIAIVDLQKQLKEKDKEIAELEEITDSIVSTAYYKLARTDEIIKLKAQLKSQPAEIVEKIRKQIFNHFNVNNMEEYERLSLPNALFTADAVAEILDTILKEYQK